MKFVVTKTCVFAVAAVALASGCSQVLGLKDPSLARDPEDDAGVSDAAMIDASAIDSSIDAPPVTDLWVFTTNAQSVGDFGLPNGARLIGDAKCQDMYAATYTARQCTHIHAVLQIDNNLDTLGRMAGTYQIPTGIKVSRASDGAKVVADWDTFIDPNLALLSPVSTEASPFPIWTGVVNDRQCNNWTSRDSTVFGTTGNAAIMTRGWLSQASSLCNDIRPHLLCVCW